MGNSNLKIANLKKAINTNANPDIDVVIDGVCSQLQRIFALYDLDHSNTVSLKEWSTLYIALKELEGIDEEKAKAEAVKVFKARDLDGNGMLSFEEFRSDAFQRCFFDKATKDMQLSKSSAEGKGSSLDSVEPEPQINPADDSWKLKHLEAMGVTVRNAYRMVLSAEVNPHGLPEIAEAFKRATSSVVDVFHAYDQDKKGYISLAEWLSVNEQLWAQLNPDLAARGPCPADAFASAKAKFEARDSNRDGMLSFDEFETDAVTRYLLAPAFKALKDSEGKHTVDNTWRMQQVNKLGLDFKTALTCLEKALKENKDKTAAVAGGADMDAKSSAPGAQ